MSLMLVPATIRVETISIFRGFDRGQLRERGLSLRLLARRGLKIGTPPTCGIVSMLTSRAQGEVPKTLPRHG